MTKAVRKSVDIAYSTSLIEEIEELIHKWHRTFGEISHCKLYMNNFTYEELKKEADNVHIPAVTYDRPLMENSTIYGLKIKIDNTLPIFTFMIKEDKEMDIPNMWAKGGVIPVTRLPKKYIINKGATVLFWEDGTKTIVKRAKDDEYNKIMGFLWAYFQKTSGLSRTKANEYLRGLVDADDLKDRNLNGVEIDTAEILGNIFKNVVDSLKNIK